MGHACTSLYIIERNDETFFNKVAIKDISELIVGELNLTAANVKKSLIAVGLRLMFD